MWNTYNPLKYSEKLKHDLTVATMHYAIENYKMKQNIVSKLQEKSIMSYGYIPEIVSQNLKHGYNFFVTCL